MQCEVGSQLAGWFDWQNQLSWVLNLPAGDGKIGDTSVLHCFVSHYHGSDDDNNNNMRAISSHGKALQVSSLSLSSLQWLYLSGWLTRVTFRVAPHTSL